MARKRKQETPGQREIDFQAASFERLLEIQLPGGHGVRPRVLQAVLTALYRFGRGKPCWPGQAKIAAVAGEQLGGEPLSERQTREALHVLEHVLGLVVSYRAQPPDQGQAWDRKTLTHYVIIWTELAAWRQRASGATKPASTMGPPATMPDHSGDQAAARGGSADSSPGADRQNLPVDRQNLPVDVRRHNISARTIGSRKEVEGSNTTTTTFSALRTSVTDQTASAGQDWEEVEVELYRVGIGIRQQLVDAWRAAGRDPVELVQEVREVSARARANDDGRFRSVTSAMVWRLRTGVWPCEVDAEEDAKANAARRRTEDAARRWSGEMLQAYRAVRSRTPVGVQVDDAAVVEAAVARGVPREFAERDRGLCVAGDR